MSGAKDKAPTEQDHSETLSLLNEASVKLDDANKLAELGDVGQAMMAVEKCMEDLRDAIAEYDVQQDDGPLWEIGRGDVESYVGCELADITFSEFGTAVCLIFEKEDGDLHGFKLTPRESVRVCNVEEVE